MDIYNRKGYFPKSELGYYISAYGIAVKHGFEGTEEDWLASLKGEAGAPTEMRYNEEAEKLEWRLVGAEEWTGVLGLDEIRGSAYRGAVTEIKRLKEESIVAVNEAQDGAVNTVLEKAANAERNIEGIKQSAVSEIANLKTGATEQITATKDSFIQTVSNIKETTLTEVTSAKEGAVRKVSELKNSAIQTMEEKKNAVISKADDLLAKAEEVNSAKAVIDGIASEVRDIRNDVSNDVAEVRRAASSVQRTKDEADDALSRAMSLSSDIESGAHQAEQARAEALGSKNQAKTYRDQAETFSNQAKNYATQAQNAAGGGVTSFAGRAGEVEPRVSDYNTFYLPRNGKASDSAKLNGKAESHFATAQGLNNLAQVISQKANKSELITLSQSIGSKANQQEVTSLTQTVNGLTQTVAGKASQQDLESLRIEVSMAGGLKVVDGSFNNNQISVTGFTPADDAPFLLNLTSVYRNTMGIGDDTRIRFGNGSLIRLTKFNNVTFNEATIIKQRQFICVKKSDVVWIEVYPAELDNKIFDLEQRVEEAFQSARDGKIKLADAITSKGQVVDNEASFQEMASKVRDIKVGDYVAGEKIEKKDYTIHPQSKTSSSMEFNAYGSRNYYIKPYRGNYFQFWTGQSREGSGYNRVYSILYYKEVGSRYSNTISTIFKSPVYSDEYSPGVNVDLFGDMVYSASTRNNLGAICIFNMRSGKKYEKEINHSNGWYSDLVSCYSKLNVINFKSDNMKKTHVYSFIGDQIVKTGEYSYTLKEGESILDWFGKYVVVKSYNSGSRKYTLNIIDASSNSKVYSSLENSELSWSINKSYINLLVYSGNNGIYTVDLSTLANKRISAKTNLVVARLSLTDTVAFYDRDRSGNSYWQLYTPKTWRSTNWISVHEMFGDYWDSGFWDGSGSIQHCLSEDEIGYLSAQQSSNNTTRYYYYKGTICEYMTLRKRG